MSAAARPAGPPPMMPTDWRRSRGGATGLTQPRSQALSVMYFSTAPMVTAS